MVGGKTHKRRGHRSRKTVRKARAPTVESLHASFETVDRRIRALIERGATDAEVGRALQRLWSDLFHDELSAPATTGMIKHYRATSKRRTRKQRGGMAPLGLTMGQGSTASTYGAFPDSMATTGHVIQSLDRFFESPISRSCDSTGGYPPQNGGGLLDSLLGLHAPASVPHNALEVGVSAVQGAPIANPNPNPVVAAAPTTTAPLHPFSPQRITQVTDLSSVHQGY
jgi:hypothetical protein